MLKVAVFFCFCLIFVREILSVPFLDSSLYSADNPDVVGFLSLHMSSRPRHSRWTRSWREDGNENRRRKVKLGYIPPPPIDPLGEGKHKSGLESLYSDKFDQEKHDAWRKKVLIVGGRRLPLKSDQQKELEKLIIGRWKIVEDSEDRPNPHLFEKTSNIVGAFNETGASKPSTERITDKGHLIMEDLHFEEDLLFDESGSLLVTKDYTESGCFGLDWKLHNMPKPGLEMPTFQFEPLTIKFRICRKKVAVEFDECPDMNYNPGTFFYSGIFTDTTFEAIEGEIYRNRELFPDPTKPRDTVLAGKFKMEKLPNPTNNKA